MYDDLEYVVIDTETSGLPEMRDNCMDWSKVVLLEVGALHKRGHVELDRYQSLLQWPFPFEISKEAGEKHGITHQMLCEQGVPAPDVLSELNRRAYGCRLIVGHNITAFDWHVIAHAHERAGGGGFTPENLILLDTRLLFQAWHGRLRRDRYEPLASFWGRVIGSCPQVESNLPHVLQSYGIGVEQKHRAMFDCLDCARAFDLMLSYGHVGNVLGADWDIHLRCA